MTFSLELAPAPISDIAGDLARILSVPADDAATDDPHPVLVIAARRFDDGSLVWIAHDEKEVCGGSSAEDVASAAGQIDQLVLTLLPSSKQRAERVLYDVSVRDAGLAEYVVGLRREDPSQLQGLDTLPPADFLPLGERRARRLLRSGRLAESVGYHIVYSTDRVVYDPSLSSQVPGEALEAVTPQPELWFPKWTQGLHLVVSDASITHLGSTNRSIVGTAWVSSEGDWSVREGEIDRSRRRIDDINAAEIFGIVEATRGAFEHEASNVVVLCDNMRAVQLVRAIIGHDGLQFRYRTTGLDLERLLTSSDVEMLLDVRPVVSWLPKSEGHPLHVAVDALTRLRASRASEIVSTQSRAFRDKLRLG